MTRQLPMRFTSMIASSTSGSRWRSDPPRADAGVREQRRRSRRTASTTSAIARRHLILLGDVADDGDGVLAAERADLLEALGVQVEQREAVGRREPLGGLEADSLRGAGDEGDGTEHAPTLLGARAPAATRLDVLAGDAVLFEEAVVLALLDGGLCAGEADAAR